MTNDQQQTPDGVTHKQLVDAARRWLVAHGYPLVVTECVTDGDESPEFII